MSPIERTLMRVEDVLHILGCLALVAVAAIINADILLRLFFSYPVQFQFELTEIYLMPMLAVLSLSRVFRDGGHLSLEIISQKTLERIGRGALRRAILLASAIFFAAVTWMSGEFALRAFTGGEVEYGTYDWPLGWAYVAIPLGTGVLTLRLILETTRRSAQGAVTP